MIPPDADQPAAAPLRWGDLRKRLISALVLSGIGAAEIWLGGPTFVALVCVLTGAMIWELARMTSRRPDIPFESILVGCFAALCLGLAVQFGAWGALGLLLLPTGALGIVPRRDRRLTMVAGFAMLLAGFGMIELRADAGILPIVWLVGVVIFSDMLGYFAGRLIGGPKFWPRISPKKTWSGTIAGWIGAAAWGTAFVAMGLAPWQLIPFSALVSLAGQMGDIGESWIKRRAGVKDSSNLIPGHGGVMDRFDALTGAVVVVMCLGLVGTLPLPAGN